MEDILRLYKDPYLGLDYLSSGMVELEGLEDGKQKIIVNLPYPIEAPIKGQKTAQRIKTQLTEHFAKNNFVDIEIEIKQKIRSLNPRPQTKQLEGVKNIIAVASGKGGVGKSTISISLAASLQGMGTKVGILDADIYGPSQAYLMNTQKDTRSIIGKNNRMNPIVSRGIKTMSLSYLLNDEQTPAIWRGAMAAKALDQLIFSTNWGDLDYLIVDMPPGTGDIQLTLCQRVSLSAAIIVSTPHQLALTGANKAVEMFRKLNVPLLGIIENMAYYDCLQCKKRQYIFGKGKSLAFAADKNIKFLKELPLEEDSSEAVQQDRLPKDWQELAFNICLDISKLSSIRLPEIEIVND